MKKHEWTTTEDGRVVLDRSIAERVIGGARKTERPVRTPELMRPDHRSKLQQSFS